MATSHATIKAALLGIYNSAKATSMSEDSFADQMATVIQDAILSADLDGTATGAQTGGPGVPVVGSLL